MAIDLNKAERDVVATQLERFISEADDVEQAMAEDPSLEDKDWCEVQTSYEEDLESARTALEKVRREDDG